MTSLLQVTFKVRRQIVSNSRSRCTVCRLCHRSWLTRSIRVSAECSLLGERRWRGNSPLTTPGGQGWRPWTRRIPMLSFTWSC